MTRVVLRWVWVCSVSVGLACRHSAHMQRWSGGASPRRGAQHTRPNVRRPKLASPAAFAHVGSCQGTGLPWETPKNAGCYGGWGLYAPVDDTEHEEHEEPQPDRQGEDSSLTNDRVGMRRHWRVEERLQVVETHRPERHQHEDEDTLQDGAGAALYAGSKHYPERILGISRGVELAVRA
eukprot:scaffold17813_cov74-Phaeocystis_antarctica.AAC.1